MKRILAKPCVAGATLGTVLAHVFDLRRSIARADTPQLPANIPLAAEPLLAFVTHSSHEARAAQD